MTLTHRERTRRKLDQAALQEAKMRAFAERGRHIGQADLSTFIDGLDIPETARAQLRALTPASYIGRAEALAKKV